MGERVDPTRQGIQKAIEEGRFIMEIMDQHYDNVMAEIRKKTQDSRRNGSPDARIP